MVTIQILQTKEIKDCQGFDQLAFQLCAFPIQLVLLQIYTVYCWRATLVSSTESKDT